jgi:hypothetical protein
MNVFTDRLLVILTDALDLRREKLDEARPSGINLTLSKRIFGAISNFEREIKTVNDKFRSLEK